MVGYPYSLRQLSYFLAVADSGSISGAATKLNVSIGALSEGLSQLEKDLGVQLLIRRRAKGVGLTNAGYDLLEHARDVMNNAEALRARARGRDVAMAGRLAVGCYTTIAPFLLPPLIAGFGKRHPAVQISVIEGTADEVQAQLEAGRCELALLYNVDLWPGIAFDVICQLRPYVLLPAGHPLAKQKAVDLSKLVDEPLIVYDSGSYNTQRIFQELGLTPNVAFRTGHFELIRSMVAQGLGYAILIQRPPGATSYQGRRLAARAIAHTKAEYSLSLAYWAQNAKSARFGALRGVFLQELAKIRRLGFAPVSG